MHSHLLLASACAAVVLGVHAEARAQCSSTACGTVPLDLGSLGSGAIGLGVSADGGVVVGYGDVSGISHAFRWTQAGGMQDIHDGTVFSVLSYAYGVSADGSVVVGEGFNGAATHAFRWTQGSGMVDINDGGFSSSIATSVSADGGVVVGYGGLGGLYHAFRWTQGTGMVNIDASMFSNGSDATGVSADGRVVVGSGNTGPAYHAFRWTDTGGISDIHDATVFSSGSRANGVSADGKVVVGVGLNGGIQHAFRWTETDHMVDIHGGGFSDSSANGVNADGSVVVGFGSTGAGYRAFRWMQATGMANLNTLLANAGVNMSGIVLTQANAVSANGQFITGTGIFSGNGHPYLVRYQDGLTGLTTPDSLRGSVDVLAQARGSVMAQHHGFAAPLLGADRPIGLGTEAGIFAAAGSVTGGGYARYGSANGFAVLGGFAYANENYARADLKDSITAAAAVQYVYDTESWWRPFVEAGGWIAPDARLSFERSYINGAGTATGTGATRGDLSYYYTRGGILLAQTQATQIALSAEIGRERLKLNAYSEQDGIANPFPATLSAGTDRMNVFKARAQASHTFDARIDATLYGAWAHGFDRRSDVVAYVLPFGAITPNIGSTLDWFEYGARVGYRLTEAMTLDVFANGVSGNDGIGSKLHGGAGLRMRF